jgi:hypothetical protein
LIILQKQLKYQYPHKYARYKQISQQIITFGDFGDLRAGLGRWVLSVPGRGAAQWAGAIFNIYMDC